MTHRTLTISRMLQPRSEGRYQPAPFLRLVGQWMQEAGFPVGRRVSVKVEPGRLVLTPLEPDDGEG